MISVLLPSRGRPTNLARLIGSAKDTADTEVEFVVYADDDDPETAKMGEGLGAKVVVGLRIVLSETWNRCFEQSSHDLLMHCGDDIIFRSPGWDTEVAKAFEQYPDRILLVHGDDGAWGDRFGTHSFIHRRWAETLGYFVPPYFSSDYNDTWLNDVANMLGRRVYLPQVITEHMHFAFGKGPLDQTHQERLERHRQDGVDALYARLAHERQQDAAKLRAVMV